MTETKLVSGNIELVKLDVWFVKAAVGAKFPNTLTVILPDPMLSYWSLKVISDVIVSPELVADPLKLTAKVKLPKLFTAIAALEEVNDWTSWEL